jgi:hypothetical protein
MDENAEILRAMARDGDNLSVPRDVDFSIIFNNEDDARRFISNIMSIYPDIRCRIAELSDVTVTKFMIPTVNNISDFEAIIGELASKFNGINDGWGCFSVSIP